MGKVRTGKKPEQPPRGTPSYMLTYGDMTTLLLVFFVALFKLGDAVSDAKSISALMSFRSGVGVMQGSISVMKPDEVLLVPSVPGDQAGALFNPEEDFSIQTLEKMMEELKKQMEEKQGKVTLEEGGLKVRLGSQAMFPLGSADLQDSAKKELADIAVLAKQYNLEITVEGHTDDRPISGPVYQSNWELSAHRATNVLRYMRDSGGLQPDYLTAIGRGEYKPICDTTATPTEDCYQQNRRVEILLRPTASTPADVNVEEIKKLFGQPEAPTEP
jgi:chemotaxis protein MotB